MDSGGYVYLICDPVKEHYKIGVTRNPNCNRIKQLQTANSSKLHIVDMIQVEQPFLLEKLLHKNFILKKQEGEWYDLSVYDVSKFKDTCEYYKNYINNIKHNVFIRENYKK